MVAENQRLRLQGPGQILERTNLLPMQPFHTEPQCWLPFKNLHGSAGSVWTKGGSCKCFVLSKICPDSSKRSQNHEMALSDLSDRIYAFHVSVWNTLVSAKYIKKIKTCWRKLSLGNVSSFASWAFCLQCCWKLPVAFYIRCIANEKKIYFFSGYFQLS